MATDTDTTNVFVITKFPKRQAQDQDKTYLCFDGTCPPWEKEIFHVKDKQERSWFCHDTDMEMSQNALQLMANKIKEEYKPTSQRELKRRLHSPLNIQIVFCRAANADELCEMLSKVVVTQV